MDDFNYVCNVYCESIDELDKITDSDRINLVIKKNKPNHSGRSLRRFCLN